MRAGRSRDEISYRYAQRTGASLAAALTLVRRFADEVDGFAAPNARAPYRGRSRYLEPARLREVWLHVTDRCNLACRHCLVSSGPQQSEDLDTDELRRVIREARELGADTFYFTGGEPLLRADALVLLDEVTKECSATAVVLTNGTLLDEELAGALAELPLGRLFLQVSLDGSCAERNDAVRSAGSFDGAVRGIRCARAAGLDVTVASVVLRDNLDDLPALAGLVRGLGVGHLHLMWQHVRERGGRFARADLDELATAVCALHRHAREIGLVVDNFENVRRTVNGDPGIKYDLSNACWDSLAIYRDGRVFPSACLVGIAQESAGTVRESRLRRLWLDTERFANCRARSVVESAQLSEDPWLFIHGGGDPEHAYFASAGGNGATDPYLPVHRAIIGSVVDEVVGERRALMRGEPAGPIVYHMMGDDGYGCPIEAGVRNGGEHKLDFVHSNCVLIQDVIAKSRAEIEAYYGEAARQPKTEICQPGVLPPQAVAHIPDEVVARSYGCGSPVMAAGLREGETALDLGSGAGMECFVAARMVGASGRVIGVDMTPDMLRFANEARAEVAERLGYDNVSFARGFLEGLPLADGSVDAVISNCVINLSPEKLRVFSEIGRVLKPGGRMVISDIVSREPIPADIRFNPRLKGECIAGALTEAKLLATLPKVGLAGIEVMEKTHWRNVEGSDFDTVTVRAWKPDTRARVSYRYPGPFRSVTLDSGIEVGRGQEVELPAGLVPAREDGGRAESAPAAPTLMRDCAVCGAPLVYLDHEEPMECAVCGRTQPANARCELGHFVCDEWHAADHMAHIRTICRATRETDPIAIFLQARRSHVFPLHGPEHHALVPAAFLTAYRNRFGEPALGRIEAAIERGARLPGGTCAYWGGCAAALGVGIAFSTILRATPLSYGERGSVQRVVSTILAALGGFDNPRCCQRESILSLKLGCELSADHLPHALECGPPPPCDQMALNRECLGESCPLHPASVEGSAGGWS